ncbi:hypothetical protein ACLPHZ_19295, partial [Alcaligenaceae bacterium Me47]
MNILAYKLSRFFPLVRSGGGLILLAGGAAWPLLARKRLSGSGRSNFFLPSSAAYLFEIFK